MACSRRIGLAFGLVLLSLLTADIAAGQGNIRGRVFYEDGRAADRVTVELRNFTDMGVTQTTTDAAGNYAFLSVARGVYYVTVRLTGFLEANQRIEVGVFPNEAVHLTLRREPVKEGKNAVPPIPAVSAEYLKIPPKAREAYELGMKQYRVDNQLEKSLESLRQATKAYPEFAQAHYGMGLLLIDLDRLDEAREALQKAVTADEELVPAYFPLGAILNQKRGFAEAEKVLRKGLSVREDIWQLHFELARAVAYQGRWQEAETIAERAAQLNENAEKVQLLLANIYFELGKDNEALDAAERFLKLAPDDPIAPQIRARVQQMRPAKPPR